MLNKILKGNSDGAKIVFRFIVLTVFCILTFLLFSSVVSLIILKTDFSYEILPVITAIILAVSAFACGFVISMLFKENGIVWGIFAAITIFAALVAVSVYTGRFCFSKALLIRFAITVIAGAAGGIAGVNMS